MEEDYHENDSSNDGIIEEDDSSSDSTTEEDNCLSGLFAAVDAVADILGPDAFGGLPSKDSGAICNVREEDLGPVVEQSASIMDSAASIAEEPKKEEALHIAEEAKRELSPILEIPPLSKEENEALSELWQFMVANQGKAQAANDRMRSGNLHKRRDDEALEREDAAAIDVNAITGNRNWASGAVSFISSFSSTAGASASKRRSSMAAVYSPGGGTRVSGSEYLEGRIKAITPDLEVLNGELEFVKFYHDSGVEIQEQIWSQFDVDNPGIWNLIRLLLVPVSQFEAISSEADRVMATLLALPVNEQELFLNGAAASMAYLNRKEKGTNYLREENKLEEMPGGSDGQDFAVAPHGHMSEDEATGGVKEIVVEQSAAINAITGNRCMASGAVSFISSFSSTAGASASKRRSSMAAVYSPGGGTRVSGSEYLEGRIKAITPDLKLLNGELEFVKVYHESCFEIQEEFWSMVDADDVDQWNISRLLLVPVSRFEAISREADRVMATLLDLPVEDQEQLLNIAAASMEYLNTIEEDNKNSIDNTNTKDWNSPNSPISRSTRSSKASPIRGHTRRAQRRGSMLHSPPLQNVSYDRRSSRARSTAASSTPCSANVRRSPRLTDRRSSTGATRSDDNIAVDPTELSSRSSDDNESSSYQGTIASIDSGINIGTEDPYELVSNHPGVCLRKNKVKPKQVTPEERQDVVGHVFTYLRKLSAMKCYNRDAKYTTACRCLHGLDDDTLASLSEAVVSFFVLPKDLRETLLKERLKSAEDRRCLHEKQSQMRSYRASIDDKKLLFFRLDAGPQLCQLSVCQNTFRNVLCIFRRPWEKLKSSVSAESYQVGPHIHGNVGTTHRHASSNQRKCVESIKTYLQELADTCGDSYATRFIREKTSVGLRNEEIGNIELPSNMSYRSIYCGWCYSVGYKPTSNAKGNFGPVSEFAKRPCDADVWPEGSHGDVCSWSSFQKVWKKYFPHMKIRNRCEDVCGECVRLRNSFQYLKKLKTVSQHNRIQGVQDEDSDDSSHLTDDSMSSKKTDDASLVEDLQEKEFPEEYLWFRANDHAMKAQAQRQLVKDREREAKESRDSPHEERNYCLVADYCQNLSLPYFGGEQPGDTYYFSPLFVYVFGIADVSNERAQLLGYGYHEGEGAKGGNNVASLLIKGLKDLGWLIEGRRGGRLSIVMDNCGGQNKNKMVLRLATYLVEKNYFSTVEFIFYIRGHTKNVCDRLFNLLKIRYHKSNVYTMEMLVDVLNKMDDIQFFHVSSNQFYNYDKMLDCFYKNFKAGSIQKNHYFVVHSNAPTTMITKSYINDNDETTFNFYKNVPHRSVLLETYTMERLNLPGIRDIKQVELWKNWRQYVPDPYKDSICPKPTEEVLEKIKREKSKKQQEKAKVNQSKKQQEKATVNQSKKQPEKATVNERKKRQQKPKVNNGKKPRATRNKT